MKGILKLENMEDSIVSDRDFAYTFALYVVTVVIFINLNSLQSPYIGLLASAIYWVINAFFLGNAFFKDETRFFRLLFGGILLIMLVGFVGWVIMLIYNLDIVRSTLVLLVTATVSSFLNRRMKRGNAT